MKISYKVLKNYIKNIKSVEEVAEDLIMHTAEVEEIIYEAENLKSVYVGEIKEVKKHPEADKLNICKVEVLGEEKQIVCGAPNVKVGLKVAVAVVGAKLAEDFVIKKTKIRGETSEGMMCSLDELGLCKERQEGIMELNKDAKLGLNMREYLKKDDIILEVDNKAINHRPDLFSHIGIIRELYAINNEKFDFEYASRDFGKLKDLGIKNEIPEAVKRYIGIKIENVSNIESPEYIKQVLNSFDTGSKGLLIDVTNYSLYLYGQPTHCFDADKISGKITIRYAKKDEPFTSLKDIDYKLSEQDIVIADEEKVLALGGVIGGKSSATSDETKNIVIESAHFDQAVVRKTGKKYGIRTDSLNVFEKDILKSMNIAGASLIVEELEKNLENIKLVSYSDCYEEKQKEVKIPFDLEYINNLLGKKYEEKSVIKILSNLGIKTEGDFLKIPNWRKDLNYKSDIAEEVARIDGYNKIENTIPKVNLGAVLQDNIYKIKNDIRNFFCNIGFFDMYTYSFVSEELMKKTNLSIENLVKMKNALSEELSHLKSSHIPNLLNTIEKNKNNFKELKIFEIEKVFRSTGDKIEENYSLAGLIESNKKIVYYELQNIISNLFKKIGISNFEYKSKKENIYFSHSGRTANIIIRGKEIGNIGEISPKVANNFEIKNRLGYFEINIDKIKEVVYGKTKAKEISSFQENNFDLNFVVGRTVEGSKIQNLIQNTDKDIITKVDLVDIYEDKEKLKDKRSLVFKIYIQSTQTTLDDKVKNELIDKIIKKVEKAGATLR